MTILSRTKQVRQAMLKIDKNVPLPRIRRQFRQTALLKNVGKGDSFLLPIDTTAERAAWYLAAVRLNIKITIRNTYDGPRLWRVK